MRQDRSLEKSQDKKQDEDQGKDQDKDQNKDQDQDREKHQEKDREKRPGGTQKTGEPYNPITQGPIVRQLLLFFFPILLGSMFQQLYNTVDAIIVGKVLGKAALGAVGGSTYMIINLIIYLFLGLSNGAVVAASQAYGAGRMEDFRRVVHTAVAVALGAGGLFTVLGLLLSPLVLRSIGTPAEVLEPAITYILIYSTGYIPCCLYNCGAGIIRASGDSRRPLYYLAAASVVNVGLDCLFMMVFHMGVAGAAWATVLAQVISALLVLVRLFDKKGIYRLRLAELKPDWQIMKRIFYIGIPSGIQSDMYSVANLIMQIQVNSYGTNTVAAFSAYEKIDGFFWMTMSAFGMAVTAFTGQNFGAGNWGRVRKGLNRCFFMAAAAAVLFAAVFMTFSAFFMGLFTGDPDVILVGVRMMAELSPFYITYVCTEIYGGGIRGCGESFVPMVITILGVCVIRVIWTGIVHSVGGDMSLLMTGYPMTWSITSAAIMIYYVKGNWMRRYQKPQVKGL